MDKTTPAYNSGIREGDELISINDKIFTDKSEYSKLLKEEGKEVKLKIRNKSGQLRVIILKLEKLL